MEEQKKIIRNIKRKAEIIEEQLSSHKIKDNYGLCNRCKYFRVIERELDAIIDCQQSIWETIGKVHLTKQNKVIDCSQFEPVGSLSINALWAMAKLIDIDDSKIGFGLNKEVKTADTEEIDEYE